MNINRKKIASLILTSLKEKQQELREQFIQSKGSIGYFILDDFLPNDFALQVYQSFPETKSTVKKHNLRESKYVGYQMNEFHPVLEEVIYAFQADEVVNMIADICQIKHVSPDASLYAGGISLMEKQNFLNPHLDNSHDKDRNQWRVLNLLYYVTPEWKLNDGGNLELWPNGVKNEPITLESKFNRLVVMATHQKSWHSVSEVLSDKTRCCISNYYFSKIPLLKKDSFHVTTFRGRPKEKGKDIILQFDNFLRTSLRKLFKKGVRKNKHQYEK